MLVRGARGAWWAIRSRYFQKLNRYMNMGMRTFIYPGRLLDEAKYFSPDSRNGTGYAPDNRAVVVGIGVIKVVDPRLIGSL